MASLHFVAVSARAELLLLAAVVLLGAPTICQRASSTMCLGAKGYMVKY